MLTRKKILLIIFLIPLLFIGITCKHDRENGSLALSMTEYLTKELNLTKEQSKKVYIIVLKGEKETRKLVQQNSKDKDPVVHQIMKFRAIGSEVEKILTPEQNAQFLELQYNFEKRTISYVKSIIVVVFWAVLLTIIILLFFNKRLKKRVKRRTIDLETINVELQDKSERLQDLNRTLEEKVQERTEELQQKNQILEERSDIIERELVMARNIQEQLIPSGTPTEYISALYKPMDAVGGDFYDFIEFRDSDHIGIFISDVSGHGVPAALITSMIKSILLRSGDLRGNPAALLAHMNEVLLDNIAQNFFTSFYGIYDPTHKKVYYASAGHNEPYIISEGRVEQMKGRRSVPIGFLENHELEKKNKPYVTEIYDVPEDAKILFYTDGLVEAEPLDKRYHFFEDNGLEEVLLNNSHLSSDEFLAEVYTELAQFRGAEEFDDDICLICLDVNK
jgi:serine phosphatase RsbU (regulator of sigma subunit)